MTSVLISLILAAPSAAMATVQEEELQGILKAAGKYESYTFSGTSRTEGLPGRAGGAGRRAL